MSNTLTPARPKRESKSMRLKAERAAWWRDFWQYQSELEKERDLFVQNITVLVVDPADRKESYSAIIDSRRGIVIK